MSKEYIKDQGIYDSPARHDTRRKLVSASTENGIKKVSKKVSRKVSAELEGKVSKHASN